MPVITVPNRSFLAFQRPADKSVYEWRNSQPLRFGKNDTGYQWNEFFSPTSLPLTEQKYFCKDTVSGNKMWMESPENYFPSNKYIDAPFAIVRLSFSSPDGSDDVAYITDYTKEAIGYSKIYLGNPNRVLDDTQYWHLLTFRIYFEDQEIVPNYGLKYFNISFSENMPYSLYTIFAQGISYSEIGLGGGTIESPESIRMGDAGVSLYSTLLTNLSKPDYNMPPTKIFNAASNAEGWHGIYCDFYFYL